LRGELDLVEHDLHIGRDPGDGHRAGQAAAEGQGEGAAEAEQAEAKAGREAEAAGSTNDVDDQFGADGRRADRAVEA
jgi:hypothetical protein